MGVKVRGAKELRRTLKKAGVDVKQLKSINRAAAQIAATAAVGMSPVGGPYKKAGRGRPRQGGKLKKSIRAYATQRAGVIRAGGASIPYAGPVHWGWPRTTGRQGSGIRANPWMSRAAESTEPEWTRVYERHVLDTINNVKGI